MPPLDFPSAPAINDTWTGSNGVSYTWTGTMWVVSGSGTGPYLLTAGGTMTGPIQLAADPVTDPQASTKHYVDNAINLAGNYLGTWAVASNTPNISAGGSISNANYVATTSNPAVPETVPVGVPGIAGMTVANGDRIIWAAGLGTWQILRNAGVTLSAADARYYPLATNPSGYATLASPPLTGNPTAPTPTAGDNDTSIATTAFVQAAVIAADDNTNYVDNSGFSVNQRTYVSGTALTSGAFGHDRWKGGASGCTYTFSGTSAATVVTITAGSLQQVVEGAALTSGSYTLSWTGTAQGRTGAGSYAASPVAVTATAGTNLTIEFNAGTLSRVRLELGTAATPWQPRPAAQEVVACQRFANTIKVHLRSTATGAGQIFSQTLSFPPMRTIPTATATAGGSNANISVGSASAYTASAAIVSITAAGAGDAYMTDLVYLLSADL